MLISISKHLMLKFIDQAVQELILATNFKTSYVEVYQVAAAVIGFVLANFKTSYVEVYVYSTKKYTVTGKFQNILC